MEKTRRTPSPQAHESTTSWVKGTLIERLQTQEWECPSAVRSRPSPYLISAASDVLSSWLFPGFHEDNLDHTVSETLVETLERQFAAGFHSLCSLGDLDSCQACQKAGREAVDDLLRSLPEIQRRLCLDIEAAFRGDPSARSREEIILCYPGFRAVTQYRIAHQMHRLGVPLLPRMLSERAHAITGIDIHPAAVLGEGLFMDHGTGIVIGETCRVGNGVRIYQGVTLGAKKIPLNSAERATRRIPRHPIVEDQVVIYAGATVLGPVTIGSESIIGGNVWLTHSVPPRSRVSQALLRQSSFTEGAGI